MNYKSELEILLGCQAKHPNAQAALYNLYKGRLLGVCMRYTRTKAEAEDIFQEAFVKIFLKIETINKTESLGAWVKSVVVNTATDHYRKNLKDNFLTQIDGFEVADQAEEIDLDGIENSKLLDLINQMPAGYRMAVNMYYIDGFKHHEIAEMTGISLSTSKSQLYHAKAWLRTKIVDLKMKIENFI